MCCFLLLLVKEMDGSSRKEEACCPKLLDLISKDKEWLAKRGGEYNNTSNNIRRHGSSSSSSDHENKLQLRLGLPGDDGDDDQGNYNNWSSPNPKISNNSTTTTDNRDESLLTLNHFSSPASMSHHHNVNSHNNKTSITACCQDQKQKQVLSCPSSWSGGCHHQQQLKNPSFLQYHQTSGSKMLPPPPPPAHPTHTTAAVTKESSQPCCNRIVDRQTPPVQKKAFSQSPVNTAVPNTSQKRAAPAPVVGWPPIRSFRKNLASTSSVSTKPVSESKDVVKETKPVEANNGKGLFVKINMDGVAIGRKVDLHAYDSYEKLSSAVDKLFSGLLAAQRDSSVGGIQNKVEEEEKSIAAGILDGSGEYTLTYEDNEGDRMLVGDVPWHMFVSTVKRLRVLKSSDLSSLSRGGGKKVC